MKFIQMFMWRNLCSLSLSLSLSVMCDALIRCISCSLADCWSLVLMWKSLRAFALIFLTLLVTESKQARSEIKKATAQFHLCSSFLFSCGQEASN